MKKLIYCILFLSQLLTVAFAQAFVVKRIEIQGLQRITPATVKSYLPIKQGQTLQPAKTAIILRTLYQTGFFERITLSKENGTLIIHVIERPTIGQLKITGNSVIPTDKLTTVMKTLDIAEGRIYNPAMLERIKQGLLNQYYQLGRYNARVDITTAPMSRNRLLVRVTISEGLIARIRRISIAGNHVFKENTLIKQLDITTSGILTWISQSDRYSDMKLDENLEKLRNYYMDHGYIRFAVKSAQAEITPDRKSVYINIVVDEGERYTVESYEVRGQLILPKEEYIKIIGIKPGETFSKKKIMAAEKAITTRLGDKGYLFATIELQPNINDQTHQVILVFHMTPGKRIYIRHITFSDNNRTNDMTLRRGIEQLEAAPASSSRLEESKHKLSLEPYLKDVEMSVNPVPDVNDQADVNYKVVEDNSAQVTFKLGYSQLYRTLIGAGLNQKNFFGTGNTLGINFSKSKYEQFYVIEYTDPYYTEDGISRTFDLSLSRTDPRGAGVGSGFTTNEYGAGVLFGIPVGQETGVYNRLQVGLGYQNTLVNLSESFDNISTQVSSFVNNHGRHFQELDIKLGYTRDSRDKAIFPTSGAAQSLFLDTYAPLDRNSLKFYTLNYHGKWYKPLTDQFIISSRADLGYGNALHGARNYPFFRNYYAGGIDTVRGYEGYTLGPRDSNYNPLGGNMLMDASLALIFPNHLSDSLRTSAFVDVGNVYGSIDNRSFGGQSTNSGPPRYSMGVEADWMTPFGPIELSLAQPFRREHDKRETFQFALGANF